MTEQTHHLKNCTLHLVHGEELSLNKLPPRALALDGAVQGPEHDDQDRWSIDHHAGCLRLATSATCEQVRRMLIQGLDIRGRDVYINDVDGDTLLSLWLLENSHRVYERDVRRLVRAVGAVDAHGPAGKLELSDEEKALADVFFSPAGVYGVVPQDVQDHFEEWFSIINRGVQRITEIVHGEVIAEPFPTPQFKMLYEDSDHFAILVEGGGFGVFEPLYKEGFSVVIVTDGNGMYTIGKRSDLVLYPLGPHTDPDSLLGRLRAREPGWGGGSTIGGSPRPDGSGLKPWLVWEEVAGLLENNQ